MRVVCSTMHRTHIYPDTRTYLCNLNDKTGITVKNRISAQDMVEGNLNDIVSVIYQVLK